MSISTTIYLLAVLSNINIFLALCVFLSTAFYIGYRVIVKVEDIDKENDKILPYKKKLEWFMIIGWIILILMPSKTEMYSIYVINKVEKMEYKDYMVIRNEITNILRSKDEK